MNKSAALYLTALLSLCSAKILAAPLLSDTFSDPNGPLLGNSPQTGGTWTITGTSVVNPLSVTGGSVGMTNTGQDAYSQLSSSISTAAGGSVFVGMDLDVTSAASTGDYFLNFTTTVGGTSGFYDKVWIKSSGSGFVLGSQDSNGTVTYGSTVLLFGSDYRLVTEEDFISGAANDTFEFYLNPTDLSVAANDTAYLNATWSGSVAEAATYAELSLRQGTAGSASSQTIDNLVVSQTFSDVAPEPTPEPATLALATLSGLGCLFMLRRKH